MLEYLPGRLGLIQLASRGALQRHLLRPREVGDGSSCKAMGLVEARQSPGGGEGGGVVELGFIIVRVPSICWSPLAL
ncbi:unnamed protein product [Prorocentrum cordatum]|uniref:Uncharacterized protein n=1 Tax=Prorocentrum cordatum TaxID=2364126 RepID=A0ABN9TFP8_9DINO|nr:unnamed protein product [Polarella glacialis]